MRAFVETLDYWSYLVSEYPKNEKAARYKFLNIEYLIDSIETWENNPDTTDSGLYAWLNRITLLSRDDMEEDSLLGKVNLMTIHASKAWNFRLCLSQAAKTVLYRMRAALKTAKAASKKKGACFTLRLRAGQTVYFVVQKAA